MCFNMTIVDLYHTLAAGRTNTTNQHQLIAIQKHIVVSRFSLDLFGYEAQISPGVSSHGCHRQAMCFNMVWYAVSELT
jgi:hypothetical protein